MEKNKTCISNKYGQNTIGIIYIYIPTWLNIANMIYIYIWLSNSILIAIFMNPLLNMYIVYIVYIWVNYTNSLT